MANVTVGAVAGAVPDAVDEHAVHKVPNPFPLTLAGMLAALGPQAINFGISIGGGEAYLLPNISARGTLHMHWLMTISVVLETALVYECIKYSVCTGRSFFAATNDLEPLRLLAVVLGGRDHPDLRVAGLDGRRGHRRAPVHRHRQPAAVLGLPPHYLWAVIALVAVLVVFYFSDRTYASSRSSSPFIMFANIVLVLAVTVIAAKPQHYWQVLLGYLGITFLTEGYPAALPKTDALALFNQPGGSLMWVASGSSRPASAWAGTPGRSPACSGRPRRSPPRSCAGTRATPTSGARCSSGSKLGGYSLILWWAIIGGLIMTYLYSVAGLAYLHEDFLKTGKIPTGVAGADPDGHHRPGRAGADGRLADAAVHHGHALRRAVPALRHVHRPHDLRRHRGDRQGAAARTASTTSSW